MENLVYLLFGPVGCVLGMAAWMAMMDFRRRRLAGDPNPAACVEPASQPAQQTEAHHG